jgi:hypothetical protein
MRRRYNEATTMKGLYLEREGMSGWMEGNCGRGRRERGTGI